MARILLVEDVALVRMTFRRFMEKAGHEVTECVGGEEALRVLKSDVFDLVVTDIWMQAGDGLDFIGKIRASGRRLPILAITGGDPRSPLASSAEAAQDAGATHVVLKPVSKSQLMATIESMLPGTETLEPLERPLS